MDINSIGSAPYFPGSTPAPAPAQHPVQGVVRENPAATGNPQGAEPVPASAETRNEAGQNDRQNLQDSVEALNDFVKLQNTSLQFSIDDESGTVIVQVTDKETNEVIKQFPSEEAIELAKALDKLKGLLLHQQA